MVMNSYVIRCVYRNKILHYCNVYRRYYVSSDEIFPSAYDATRVEGKWKTYWENEGLYTAAREKDAPLKEMLLPPPNVTGSLHLGHALQLTAQDVIARWRRMCGDRISWLPGVDHAGIATQAVVERRLAAMKPPLKKQDMERDTFLEHMWQWKEEFGSRILHQMRHLGASLNWDHEFFTLDSARSQAVTEAFVRLHDAGLIYRSNRMINWSCHLRTAISDAEVTHYSVTGGGRKLTLPGVNSKGKPRSVDVGYIYEIGYPLVDASTDSNGCCCNSDDILWVATTRPETILGDTGVAVNPNDTRYSHFIGKRLQHPLLVDRTLPVISDAEFVDPNLGTGAVKITPAHSVDDYAFSLRHGIPVVDILNADGTLRGDVCGSSFDGMDRFVGRNVVLRRLGELQLYRGRRDHDMSVPLCSRTGDIIEPIRRPQWFVKSERLSSAIMNRITPVEGDGVFSPNSVVFTASANHHDMVMAPPFHVSEWQRWLGTPLDWCISRQLWWGHRVPAYRIIRSNSDIKENTELSENDWVIGRDESEARIRAEKLVASGESFTLEQDNDVLDTWFSSALLPLSSRGWGNGVDNAVSAYPPLLTLETGSDILFFWVARMAMMCTYLNDGVLPFRSILLHPMIRDAQGRKMSKSLGNVIDPMDVIHGASLDSLLNNIKQGNLAKNEVQLAMKQMRRDFPNGFPVCGTDALRLTLADGLSDGARLITFDVKRVDWSRRFCTKLWNAARFANNYWDLDTTDISESTVSSAGQTPLLVRWLRQRTIRAIENVTKGLVTGNLHGATSAVTSLVWDDLCDVFIELGRFEMQTSPVDSVCRRLYVSALYDTLSVCLRLSHPVIPFITEELWHRLPGTEGSIMLSPFPCHDDYTVSTNDDMTVESDIAILRNIISNGRELRRILGVPASSRLSLSIYTNSEPDNGHLRNMLRDHEPMLLGTMALNTINYNSRKCSDDIAVSLAISEQCSFSLSLGNIVVDSNRAVDELNKKLQRVETLIRAKREAILVEGYDINFPAHLKSQDAIFLQNSVALAESLRAAICQFNSS